MLVDKCLLKASWLILRMDPSSHFTCLSPSCTPITSSQANVLEIADHDSHLGTLGGLGNQCEIFEKSVG